MGRDRVLSIVLRTEFPHTPPELIVTPSPFLEWPHAESNGKICLWPEDQVPAGLSSAELVESAIAQFWEVFRLVKFGSSHQCRNDEFAREWTSYWRVPKKPDLACSETLLLLAKPGSEVALLSTGYLYTADLSAAGEKRNPSTFVVADYNADRLKNWAANSNLKTDLTQDGLALLVPLHGSPVQPGAPGTVDEIRNFISAWAIDPAQALSVFGNLVERQSETPIRIVFSQKNGAQAGLRLTQIYEKTKARGYQNSKAKRQAKKQRRRIGFDTAVLEIQRSDPEWIQERGLSPRYSDVASRHVVVIGAGSLGSMAIEGLVLSGVGKLTLVDPGFFESANVGRHTLGVASIGQSKVFALRSRLLADYPHLVIETKNKRVQELREWLQNSDADLVMCTTADPACEAFLMTCLSGEEIPSLMISWSEPHALAGHSAHSPGGSFALERLFQFGECVSPVIEWADSPTHQLPGCGASHIPGGGNRIRLISAMVVEHAVSVLLGEGGVGEHRVWAEASDIVQNHGGERIIPVRGGDAAVIRSSVPKVMHSDGF
ncbi:MAG: ThiF family adenylyltransferase [Halioglobus sp.]